MCVSVSVCLLLEYLLYNCVLAEGKCLFGNTVNREIFVLKNFHEIIFRVKIFSYASRPYENILTKKFFNSKYNGRDSWKSCVGNRVFVAIIFTESLSWRGFAVREGPPQRGGSILCSLHATLLCPAYDLFNFLGQQSNSL